ncbi:MAG: hypothetical protein JOZ62_10590 [Acidobacteriaceae bacterium]|nr:hypothetical protein [Acidobacteriaceae bacterium]
MSHFSLSEWVDLVRGVLSSDRTAEIQAHLNRGCHECHKQSDVWRRVAGCLSREPAYAPPDEAVRAVKAAFVPEKPWKWLSRFATMARLTFDSSQQVAPATVRGSISTSRQLLHESEPFVIDLRLESDPHQRSISLIGQVLNSENPGKSVEGVDVVLLSGEDLIARTAGNKSGEFELGFDSKENLQLFVNIRGHHAIGIVLPGLESSE